MKSQEAQQPTVIVIVGPTASGKSDLAVKIAKWIMRHGNKAEIISADSRQVYRGLDLGSGKITKREMRGIPHHMIDVANPKRQYSVAHYQKSARKIIYTLLAKPYTLPIICGGTALYIDALLYDYPLPDVKPNPALRKKLEKKSTEALFAELAKRDLRRAKTIDRNNRRRLIRALEIVIATGKPIPLFPKYTIHGYARYSNIMHNVEMLFPRIIKIGLRPPDDVLKTRIAKRLRARLKAGMIEEVEHLHNSGLLAGHSFSGGLSWKRLDDFGLEYRFVSRYLRQIKGSPSTYAQGARTKARARMIEAIERESWRYAKRQMTWWKRDKEIQWVKDEREALLVLRKMYVAKK